MAHPSHPRVSPQFLDWVGFGQFLVNLHGVAIPRRRAQGRVATFFVAYATREDGR
jgi:hypothetical protein